MTTDNKLEQMKAKMNKVAHTKADLTPTKTLKAKAEAKMRTKRISSYLTADEKEAFLNLIGRKTESDGLREVILKVIAKGENI
ncbi:MAG: hypothetical protein RPR97_14635 [Colwellia sp.]